MPSYDDVDMDDIHESIDTELPNIPKASEDEEISRPASFEFAGHQYNIEADVPNAQKTQFDVNRSFFGRHVVNSNTLRKDNSRHLMQMDLCEDYDLRIPTRRHRATLIRQRVTSEYQACRSNPEIGGFDRKLQHSVIKREDIDVKQLQTMGSLNKKKSGIMSFLSKKK